MRALTATAQPPSHQEAARHTRLPAQARPVVASWRSSLLKTPSHENRPTNCPPSPLPSPKRRVATTEAETAATTALGVVEHLVAGRREVIDVGAGVAWLWPYT